MKKFDNRTFLWLFAILVVLLVLWLMNPVYQLGFKKFQGNNTVKATVNWINVCGVLLLFILIWIIKIRTVSQQEQPSLPKPIGLRYITLICTSSLLIGTAIFNFWADPWDIYGTNFLESRVLPSRTVKLDFYSQLSESPEMVIVGSSTAFRIAPAYIQETLDINAFNWSINGGKALEIEILLSYLADLHPDEYPQIILMQLTEAPPSKKPYSQLPLSLLPFLDFWPLIQEGSLRLSKSIYLPQLSDSYYVLRYKLSPHTKPIANFYCLEDGFCDRIRGSFSEAAVLKQANKIPDCSSANEIFGNEIDNIITFAKEHNSSIVFYISPFLPAFYDSYLKDNPEYQNCHQLITAHFTELALQHENVFFVTTQPYMQVILP